MTGDTPESGPDGLPVPSTNGEMRASHEDRDHVVEQLRVAAGDGRLTAEELDQRLERALTARTYRELAGLTADLPAAGGGSAGPQAREVVTISCGSSHARRDGAWVVPKRIVATVASGSIYLDFTEAVITGPVLDLDVEVRSGHLTLIVGPGMMVDADDISVASGHVRVDHPHWARPAPERLRISVRGSVTSGHLRARAPRRTLWRWLIRAPHRFPPARPS